MRLRIPHFLWIFLITAPGLHPESSTSGADFLKVDTGAFAGAAGGAFTAVSEGVASLRYNPAGLAWLGRRELQLTVKPWIGDTMFFSVSYIEPVKPAKGISLGFDLTVFTTMGIDQFDVGGFPLGSTALFDLAGSFYLSYRLPLPGLSVGGGLRFIFRDVLDYYVYGLAFDLGLLWRTSFLSFTSSAHKNLSLAVSLRDVGPPLNFSDSTIGEWTSHLPTSFNIGLQYIFFSRAGASLWLAADISSYLYEEGTRYRIGLTWQPLSILSLRCGYQNGAELQAFSFGVGILVPMGGSAVRVDYAFIPLTSQMDPVHSMSLAFLF